MSFLKKCPKVIPWLEIRFLTMTMIMSGQFHIDLESLSPYIERGQKVNTTVNNANHYFFLQIILLPIFIHSG